MWKVFCFLLLRLTIYTEYVHIFISIIDDTHSHTKLWAEAQTFLLSFFSFHPLRVFGTWLDYYHLFKKKSERYTCLTNMLGVAAALMTKRFSLPSRHAQEIMARMNEKWRLMRIWTIFVIYLCKCTTTRIYNWIIMMF